MTLPRLTLLTIACATLGCASQAAFAQEATDVPATHPHKAAIDYVLEQNIMVTRDADGAFQPDVVVTREAFTSAIVQRLYPFENYDHCFDDITSAPPAAYTLLFSDVRVDAPAAKDLCVAIHAGLINGERDASFRPLKGITVAESSKIMAKAMGFVYPSLQATNEPWYRASMEALRERNAIDRYAGPAYGLTRGEMAEMFYQLRTQARYPLHRIIGETPATPEAAVAKARAQQEAKAPVTLLNPRFAERRDRRMTARAAKGESFADASSSDTIEAYDLRHAERISRRTLLAKVRAGI